MLSFTLTPYIHLTILICLQKCHLIFFSFRPSLTSKQHTTLHTLAVQFLSHCLSGICTELLISIQLSFELLCFLQMTCSIVVPRLNYCIALLCGAPEATFDKFQPIRHAQSNLAWVFCQPAANVTPLSSSVALIHLQVALTVFKMQATGTLMYLKQQQHPFSSLLSGTIRVSQYQKGFYWSKGQWVAMTSAGPYANLHLAPHR